MEFNCPACETPHAFPDDQIPDTGIVVACTHCSFHITLDPDGVRGEDNTEAIQMPGGGRGAAPPDPGPAAPPSGRDSGFGVTPLPGPMPGAGAPMGGGPGSMPGSMPGPMPGGGMPGAPKTGGTPPLGQPSVGGPGPMAGGPMAGGPMAGGPMAGPAPGGPMAGPAPGGRPMPAPGRGWPQPSGGPEVEVDPALGATAALRREDIPAPPSNRPSRSSRISSAVGNAVGAATKVLEDATGEPMAAENDLPAGLNYPGFEPGAGGTWSWRDLPRAFMGLLDTRRVVFTTAGLWAAIVVFGLVKWLGGWLGGKVALLGTVLDVVAWAALVSIFALVTAVMSYVCHQVVIERRPSSIKAGIQFVQAWLKSVVGTPLMFAGVIGAAVLAMAVLAFIGRVPFAGPIVWGITTPLTAVLLAASGLVAIALAYALPLYVPVIYNEKTGPAETLRRLANLFRAHGLRLVGYLLLSVVTIGGALAVTVVPALYLGRMFSDGVVPQAMGENLGGVVMKAPAVFQGNIVMLATPTGVGDPGFGHTLGGLFAGIGSAVLPALVLALVVLVHYTAGCIIYGIVTGRRKV